MPVPPLPLRGYVAERDQGFALEDYAMPAEAHERSPHMTLPYFNTLDFFTELRERVTAVFEERAAAAGYVGPR